MNNIKKECVKMSNQQQNNDNNQAENKEVTRGELMENLTLIDGYIKQHIAMSKDMAESIENIANKFQKFEEVIDSINAKIADMKHDLGVIENEMTALATTSSLSTVDSDINTLQFTSDNIQEDISVIKNDMEEIKDKISDFSGDFSTTSSCSILDDFCDDDEFSLLDDDDDEDDLEVVELDDLERLDKSCVMCNGTGFTMDDEGSGEMITCPWCLGDGNE
jgi:prefoldin subunit 5